jgi:SpoVK/Ycf46/Vps4 family AAA+-type ATPase
MLKVDGYPNRQLFTTLYVFVNCCIALVVACRQEILFTDSKSMKKKETVLQESKTLNMMEHIEKIISISKNSGFKPESMKRVKTHTDYVCEKLDITPEQAVLLAVIINNSDNGQAKLHEIAAHFKCTNIRLLCYRDDFENLKAKKLIKDLHETNHFGGNESTIYLVPDKVLECLQKGEKYIPETYKNYTAEQVFCQLSTWFDRFDNGSLRHDTLQKNMEELESNNRKLPLFKKINQYKLAIHNRMILLYLCHQLVNEENNEITVKEIDWLFNSMRLFQERQKIQKGKGQLFASGLIEFSKTEEMKNPSKFALTQKAIDELLGELDIELQQTKRAKDVITSKDITSKQLYYNEEEKKQIAQLVSLLKEDNFKTVQSRLKENGMRTGFACLFYGGPGTGKTETVYQLARETGRDIMMVDISQTKSMWFGESEKIIKGVFNRYRALLRDRALAPVLLFNEADAVIGKRREMNGRSGSVSQTENTIQNIILQEMETLDGIMIATTNLTQNLDAAFERRFLYKIKFEKPDIPAKQAIWQTMIPSLSETDTCLLASQFDFSGGQIENISRKRTVDAIITGIEPDIDALVSYCQNELIDKTRKRVGFI